MSNDAQKWLDELTQTINSEEEYLRQIYKDRRECPHEMIERIVNTYYSELTQQAVQMSADHAVFIGGHLHGTKVPVNNFRGEEIRVPVPTDVRYDLNITSLSRYYCTGYDFYYRRTMQVGIRTVVFWIHSEITSQGDEVALRRCLRWMRDNGFY